MVSIAVVNCPWVSQIPPKTYTNQQGDDTTLGKPTKIIHSFYCDLRSGHCVCWFINSIFKGKIPYLLGKSMVSCRFSLKPSHWYFHGELPSGYGWHSHGFSMALIEIGGLPFLIAWVDSPWRTVSHNQMVLSIYIYIYVCSVPNNSPGWISGPCGPVPKFLDDLGWLDDCHTLSPCLRSSRLLLSLQGPTKIQELR